MISYFRSTHQLPLLTAGLYFLLLFVAPTVFAGPNDPILMGRVSERIQERITIRNNTQGFVCRGEPICGIQLLPDFYASRSYEPVWVDGGGLRPTGKALFRTLTRAYEDGLNPADYHVDAIRTMVEEMDADMLLSSGDRVGHLAELDFLLTDAFLLLSSHLSGGRVNPETLHTDWILSEQSVDMMALLNTVVTEAQLDGALEQLRPAHWGYAKLRAALNQLRHLDQQGGWPRVPAGATLRPGDSNSRVLVLRHRLKISGDLSDTSDVETPELMDPSLTAAVQHFQQRHGLKQDGLVGPSTLGELNVPIKTRLRQIELNLERWRWLPHEIAERYLAVNTADFSLVAVAANEPVLRMRVVVGTPARRTPVFSATMTYLEFNPYWTIPSTIAIEDVLSKAVADPSYFEKRRITVYYGWKEDAEPMDPLQIDWTKYGENNMPFRFVQAPGPANALGRVKFMFPNKFAVYLHDTPDRSHFDLTQRDFSSGCIRVEDAPKLAQYLLRESPDWSAAAIQKALKTYERKVVRLPNPIPVHLYYLTAWVDRSGQLQFRNDIYARDAALDRALRRRVGEQQNATAVR